MKNNVNFPFERNRYFYGKLLSVRDFELEQKYHVSKRMLLNRSMFGAGVVCGMGVTCSDDSTLLIESGMALDHAGHEIIIESALIRKLQMIGGYDKLADKTTAYLCARYEEKQTEPVNAVGTDTGETSQCNLIKETCELYFSTDKPDYEQLLRYRGARNISPLYTSAQLDIVLYCTDAVCSGEEFNLNALIVRDKNTPPISFTIIGECPFIESGENSVVKLGYTQSSQEERCVIDIPFALKAQQVAGVKASLFAANTKVSVEIGDHIYRSETALDCRVEIVEDEDELKSYNHKNDTLQRKLGVQELPIYLAKLELVSSESGAFAYGITSLPFEQYVCAERGGAGAKNSMTMQVTSSVKELEYWQKPEVRTSFNSEQEKLHFSFSLPTPQAYDYGTSHGVATIPLSSGMRVNTRYISDEISHGLGMGCVNVTVSIEFDDGGENAQMFGNSEVFRSKTNKRNLPWAETAVITYPEKGTMRIGLWLHDNIDGNQIKVHYFAQRPERDTERFMHDKNGVSVKILPEVMHASPREQIRLKAVVMGAADKRIIWEVKDPDGGAVDQNGIYQAPELKGTYEVTARSNAEPDTYATGFVIVE